MKVKRISYQGVQSFLSLKGIRHDTCDDDEASYTNKENHDDVHDNIVTAADGKDEPPSDIPKTSSSTIPATIILPATFTPTTATASATTSLDATSASTRSSAISDTSSQSSEPMTPASDDPNPLLQEEEGDATSASTRSSASSDTSSQSSEPTTPASDDPNPTLQEEEGEEEGYKRPRKPYTRRFGPQTTADGKFTVQDVPNHYSLIYGSTLAELQQDAKSFHKLKNALLGQAKCNWNPLARRHLAAGMMQIPYPSFTGVEQLIPCVVASTFAAADIKVITKSLPKNCPSENLLKEIVLDGAVDCLLRLMDELKKAHAVFHWHAIKVTERVSTTWLRFSVGGTKLSDV
jgi:hypothetical protein